MNLSLRGFRFIDALSGLVTHGERRGMSMRITSAALRSLAIAACGLLLAGCPGTGVTGRGFSGLSASAPSTSVKPPVAVALVRALGSGLAPEPVLAKLSVRERNLAVQTEYRTLEYSAPGEPERWDGDKPSTFGEVTAARPYRVGSQDCRQYKHAFSVDGRRLEAQGTACRNEDGSWTRV